MKCQTAYLYVLMSNNDQVAANQPMSVVPSCRGGWMFAFYLHKNRTNKSDERIPKPFDPMTNTEQGIFKSYQWSGRASTEEGRARRPRHAADYQRFLNERRMIIRCSVMSQIIHLGLSEHGKQILQLLLMTGLKSPGCEAVWLPTSLYLSSEMSRPRTARHSSQKEQVAISFFLFFREIGCNHPPDVWIYGLVIPLWSNLAGTSAA